MLRKVSGRARGRQGRLGHVDVLLGAAAGVPHEGRRGGVGPGAVHRPLPPHHLALRALVHLALLQSTAPPPLSA